MRWFAVFSMTKRISPRSCTLIAGIVSIVSSVQVNCVLAADNIGEPAFQQRPSEQKLELEGSETKPPPQIELPAVRRPIPDSLSTKELLHFTPRDFRFKGNTVFSDEQLRGLVKQFIHTPINSIDIEEIRLIITNHYIKNGYITSGAIIPDQDLQDGLLLVEIKEGTLSDIRIRNHGRLKPKYITRRITFEDKALHLSTLQDKLFKLQRDPNIKHINARLLPGDIRGRSILELDVREDKPYSLDFELNNHRSVTIGERQGIVSFRHSNLTGWGDAFYADFRKTAATLATQIEYDVPQGIEGNQVYIQAAQNNSNLSEVDPEFDVFSNDYYSLGFGFRQLIQESKNQRYNVDYRLDHKNSEDSLPLTPCDINMGVTEVNLTSFRLAQSLTYNPRNLYFSLRHTLSVGVNALNSITCSAPNSADHHYASWLWQFIWAKRFSPYHLQAVIKGDWQITQDNLLSFEKYSLGGANSIRGYTENFIIRDQGHSLSAELRVPLKTRLRWVDSMQLLGYVDGGQAWDSDSEGTKETLASVGIGYRLYTRKSHLFELLWAKSLHEPTQAEPEQHSLQFRGIHVRLKINIK